MIDENALELAATLPFLVKYIVKEASGTKIQRADYSKPLSFIIRYRRGIL